MSAPARRSATRPCCPGPPSPSARPPRCSRPRPRPAPATCSSYRRTRPCTTSTPPTRSGRRCAPAPPSGTRRSAPSPPGSARTANSPPGSPRGAPAARPDASPNWPRRPSGHGRSPRRPKPSWPRRAACGRRPRRRPPRRSGSATSGRRPPRRPGAPPTPSPDSPSGCGNAPGWQAKLRELADDAAEAEARAQSCLERARAADEDRRAAQRAADDARRTARTLRAERSEIAGAPDDLPEDGDGAPQTSLPALREAYRAASQLYEKVGVGADLRAEQARAESDESRPRRAGPAQQQGPHPRRAAAPVARRIRRAQPAGRRRPRRGAGPAPGDPHVRRERAARPAPR